MKILFTADLHLKLNVPKIPNEWQANRYRMLGDELAKLVAQDNIELVVLGGDIFDKKPAIEEIALLFNSILVKITKTPIFIFDGNHEATKKGKTFLTSLKEFITPNTTIFDDIYLGSDFDIIPYTRLKNFDPIKHHKNNLLFTHVRGAIPPHVTPEIDLDKFNGWKLVLAGDLHAHSNSQRNIVYPGSPLTTSFHRTSVKTGVIIIDSDSLEWEWRELKLPQLIRKRVSSEEDMVPSDKFDHIIYELEGNIDSLANITNTDLLDKKIIVKNTKATLDVAEADLLDTATIYWYEVLGLDGDLITKLTTELKDSLTV